MNSFATGAFAAGLGVVLGAFGAHALSDLGDKQLAWWHTATQYLFVAAFGLMFAGTAQRRALPPTPTNPSGVATRAPSALLLAGAGLFSGSLYALALGAPRWFGAITPCGGLCLIAGFTLLGWRELSRNH